MMMLCVEDIRYHIRYHIENAGRIEDVVVYGLECNDFVKFTLEIEIGKDYRCNAKRCVHDYRIECQYTEIEFYCK